MAVPMVSRSRVLNGEAFVDPRRLNWLLASMIELEPQLLQNAILNSIF